MYSWSSAHPLCCERLWEVVALPSGPLWKAPHPLESGFHIKMSPSGQWVRGDLGNQPPCTLLDPVTLFY